MLPDFWTNLREINARQAIFHQWQQLEDSGCIHNFRLAAREAQGFREGWFFADSDAYKWLEAASRILRDTPDASLSRLVEDFIGLVGRTQCPDGYIFTYNQIHFPRVRWQNLQIEHELYCHGHLIEAAVTRFEACGQTDLLVIARQAADRIVADFRGKGAYHTPGHQEIEIALLRLHRVTPEDTAYLEMARQFLEQRGRSRWFALSVARQFLQVEGRTRKVQNRKQAYLQEHPDHHPYQLPPDNEAKKPPFTTLRWYANALSGKYFQQHVPIRRQHSAVGHSVRFAYLETAAAMLAEISGDQSLISPLERAWEHMVTRRMYVTGGIGSLPHLEGFGNDYELDPEYAYAETCAALGSMFWNAEMGKLTNKPQYGDLFEWQLYNAAAVGMGLRGNSYLYNNPLACRGGVTRQPWYAIPCCPSNISRTWANLGQYLFTSGPGQLNLHQYITIPQQVINLPAEGGGNLAIRLKVESHLPWEGFTRLHVVEVTPQDTEQHSFQLRLRLPSWAQNYTITINGKPLAVAPPPTMQYAPTAGGYDPRMAAFLPLGQPIRAGDVVETRFEMSIRLLHAHPRVKGHRGKAAITRGPLVYCLESIDNPGMDIFTIRLDSHTFTAESDPDLLDGVVKIAARSADGQRLTLIPYFLWGNRGRSNMTVWVHTGKEA